MDKLIAYLFGALMTISSVEMPANKQDITNNSINTTSEVQTVTEEQQTSNELEPTLENIIIEENADAPEAPVTTAIPYYIKVNRTQNVVNVYTVDENGEYTMPYKVMLCSTGTSTPKAGKKYKITSYRTLWNKLKGNVYGQYAVQITGNILFHSVPYTAKNNSSLEYWEYDKLGTKASLGCIRLTVEDAKWIYDNIVPGTWVEFYEDENPGPLGKPEAQKISENIENRNWDPTDLNENNPWNKVEQ